MAIITMDSEEIISCLRKAGIQEDQISLAMRVLSKVEKKPKPVYESFQRLSNSLIGWLILFFVSQALIIALIIKH